MAEVVITPAAQEEFRRLPLPIQGRVREVFVRLQRWPDVSGAKALRGNLAGNFRIRTGDYRVVFRVRGETVIVWKIGYRGDIYD
ncbi:MAG TPA: type II toxin-antitoxin system RelE/ParE family toxin [Tepidisphaeraceae bacterium]|nr:type II toxin-antitoxin system RelE/ParE family toxin [Tepidisphaeraceae bacterium]